MVFHTHFVASVCTHQRYLSDFQYFHCLQRCTLQRCSSLENRQHPLKYGYILYIIIYNIYRVTF